jgi:hypothetical protein
VACIGSFDLEGFMCVYEFRAVDLSEALWQMAVSLLVLIFP